MKRIPRTNEVRRKISEANRGEHHWDCSGANNPMYDVHLCGEMNHNFRKPKSLVQKKKQSEAMKGKMAGKNHPMYGKHHTEESILKIKNNHWNASGSNNPLYGKPGLRGENSPTWKHGKRVSNAKKLAKRRRELDYIPLNTPFVDSEGHHIDKKHVVFVPKEVNKIPHNIYKGKNIDIVNTLAYFFLMQQNIKELSILIL